MITTIAIMTRLPIHAEEKTTLSFFSSLIRFPLRNRVPLAGPASGRGRNGAQAKIAYRVEIQTARAHSASGGAWASKCR
jgi:hypothetical protein